MTTATRNPQKVENWYHTSRGPMQICYHKYITNSCAVYLLTPRGRIESYREHAEVETARDHWREIRAILAEWGYTREETRARN
jgi:adenylate cyclase